MRINIEASAEELAEISASGIAIGDLPEAIIVALVGYLWLPGYTVTVNEQSAIQAQLVEALKRCIPYVQPFVDIDETMESNNTMIEIVNALATAGAQP